jgi:Zn-finger nucleic acid-binding protein
MRWIQVGAVDLLECDRCDGTWIEADSFDRLCRDRESRAAALGISSHPPRAASERPEQVRYRPCPRCGKLMNRMNFARLSGAVVDVCRGHGTFLDRGELQQIVRFVDGGGLDRARAAERDELREEERRLRSLTPRYAGTPPAGPESGWTLRSLRDFLTALFGPEARR